MPKKFAGENSKAVAARARKEEKKQDEKIKKQKQAEEEYWKDDDRSIARKNQRKEEREKKKVESAEKKAQVKELLEKEMSSIKPVAAKQPLTKITRAQIQVETERKGRVAQVEKPQLETHLDQPLEENVNRLIVDGVEARSVEEAITALSVKEPELDRHPERRLKAAFAAFEEANMPRIKAENQTLRLSQLKQILRKEWMKSPENPLNQRL